MRNLNGIEENLDLNDLDWQRAAILINCYAFPQRFDGLDSDRADLIHYALVGGIVLALHTRRIEWPK